MLRKCMPYELDSAEIEYYDKAVETDEHSGGGIVVSRLIYAGAMDLWAWRDGESIDVIITRVIDYPDGHREMLIAMMAGKNVTSTNSHDKIHRQLLEYAISDKYCDRLVAYMKPEIWDKIGKIDGIPYKQEYIVISLSEEDLE